MFVDPFQEADEKLARMREEDRISASEDQKKTQQQVKKEEERKVYRSGVGKYVTVSGGSGEEKKASKALSSAGLKALKAFPIL